ncbi:MAG: hypothetical protein ACLTS9_11150 [Sutterella wadsworthensis]
MEYMVPAERVPMPLGQDALKETGRGRGLKVEQTAPEGLMPDPHFSTNPAKVRFEPDLKDYPAPLVKAYQNREKENPGK